MTRRIAILGAGESGTGAAILAQKMGYDVFLSDFGTIKDKYKAELTARNIAFEDGKHTENLILNADEVIKSPGIGEHVALVQQIRKKNIPIISEIEFAARFTSAKKICITGSNGKTTTTMMTYHILKDAGFKVGLGGNVGQSFAWQVAEHDFDFYVLEISSFQLDDMFDFKAEIAILMNITPDHLYRYDNKFENYVNSKFRILQNQISADSFIYCADDEVIMSEISKRNIKAQQYPFSVQNQTEQGAFIKDNILKIITKNEEFSMKEEKLPLGGIHNKYNSMAAGIAAKLNEIRNEKLRESFQSFQGVEHRLEKFIKVGGVRFINDSKATNVNSTWYALQSIDGQVILILGGKDEGNDYGILKDLVRQKVKAIVCMGADNTPIISAFSGITELYDTHSMTEAVEKAYTLAKEGDTVLLSPACKSFDLFQNYEDRGLQFKKAVREL